MQLGALEYLISINNKGLNKGIDESENQVKGLGGRFESVMSKSGKSLDRFGDKISAWAVAKGKLIANVIENVTSSAASGIKKIIGGSISAYADFEQLVGGVETLFGTRGAQDAKEYGEMVGLAGEEAEKAYSRVQAAQNIVLTNSKKAYETAGISANRYMENATSFAASLVSSLHGDTYKAAELTDIAIRDMSDNANKMGSSMESIENAYAGFAKQNFTMLDNLKLGYGGTEKEMKRLLTDAGKLAGKKFDAKNFSDIVEAIHIIQENKGITGTTAKEAATTISGSINMLKASWQNLLTTMGDPEGDVEGVSEQFYKSFKTVFKNIAPVFKQTVKNLIKLVKKALPEIIRFIRTDLIPEVLNIVRGLIDDLKASDNPFAQFIGFLADGLSLFLDENGRFKVPSIEELWEKMEPGLRALWKGIQGLASKVLVLVFGEDENGGINFPKDGEEWKQRIKAGLSKAWLFVRKALGSVLRLVFGETEDGGIDWPSSKQWGDMIKKGLDTAWGIVKGALESLLVLAFGMNEDGGIEWPKDTAAWLDLLKKGLGAVWDLVKGALSGILKIVFGESEDGGIEWPTPRELWEKVKQGFGDFWDGLKVFLRDAAIWSIGEIDLSALSDPQKVWNKIKATFTKHWKEIAVLIAGAATFGIGLLVFGAAEALWKQVKPSFEQFWEEVKGKLSDAAVWMIGLIDFGKVADFWESIKEGFAVWWGYLSTYVTKAATWMLGNVIMPPLRFIKEKIEKWWNDEIRPNIHLVLTPVVDWGEGVITELGDNLLDWGDSEHNLLHGLVKLAGFAKGTWNVPYDAPAMLHRGEMVLTASQARRYRDGEGNGEDLSSLTPAIVAAIREGMYGAQVNSFMDGKRVTKQTNGVTGRKLMAGRFAM